jgi:hypothetical protein
MFEDFYDTLPLLPRTEVFVALCLRAVIVITNYERGNDPGCEKL